MEFSHIPVLPDETIACLPTRPDGSYLDGTLGGAGHSSKICELLTTGHLYGVDRDEEAIEAAGERLKQYGDRVTILRGNYADSVRMLRELGCTGVDGILLDLGASSHQFDDAGRGFSYRFDAPLDMRMDRSEPLTAREIVNEWPEEELCRILQGYGEERFARNIAKHIAARRREGAIETTFELNEIIRAAIPAKMRQNGHPSKQTFQALRIAVNRELDALESSLGEMIDFLTPGGRICVITFHSLEDRIVKHAFQEAENPCICPPSFPVCVCGRQAKGRIVTRKPVTASARECEQNPRAKSAKLRVFERN